MKLEGKLAIVTGGASGIGKAIAEKFAEAGATGVVIADVNDEIAEQVATILASKYDSEVLAVPTDVSDPQSVREMVNVAMDRFGHIDVLVNDAGICPVVPWDETTLEDWNHILAVNLTGMFLCTKAVIPIMCSQGFGRIVYVSSTAASVGSLVAHVAYGVSKAGVIALMKTVAKTFAPYGIRANAISPGTTDTPMTGEFSSGIRESFVDNCVLRRQAEPGEIADAALYLVSDRSSYVTGHVLDVDGGFALR